MGHGPMRNIELHKIIRSLMNLYPFPCGQGRLINKTPLRHLRFQEKELVVSCLDGFSMKVMPNDYIGRHLALTGQFDRTVVTVLLSFCRNGNERILDIGANVGYVSCALLHALPSCRVCAVEPLPKCFKLLHENMRAVGGVRGQAIRSAVSDLGCAGVMKIRPGNTGASRLIMDDNLNSSNITVGSDDTIEKVEILSGLQLFEQSGLDRVDVIKIDVEGHEETVFRTLSPLLVAQQPKCILFEHGGDLSDCKAAIRRILDPLGYAIYGVRKFITGFSLAPIQQLAGKRAHDYAAILPQ